MTKIEQICHEFYMTAPNATEQQTGKLQQILEVAMAGSAETGGEEAALKRKCADCAMDEDNGCHRNFTGEAGYFHPFRAKGEL